MIALLSENKIYFQPGTILSGAILMNTPRINLFMNTFLKKSFLVAMVVMTAMWGMGGVISPSVAKAAAAGDLIRTASSSAVYYLGSDGKKHTFSSDKVFFTWFKDFSAVKTISQSEMLSYELGANVVVRPGTKLVQFVEVKGDGTFNVADPKVYAVSVSGSVHHIDSAATATAMFGANWEKNILAIPNYLFSNYTVGAGLTSSSMHPTGSLIKTADSSTIYYVDGSSIRPVSSSAFEANGFMTDYVVTVSSVSAYTQGTSITAKEEALAMPQFGTTGSVATGSGVTVSANSSTPAAQTIAKGASSAELMKFNLTAANDGAVTINQVKVKRTGVGSRNDWSNLYLYDGMNRLGYGKTINSDEVAIFTNVNLSIPAGSTKTLSLRGDMNTGANSGNKHFFVVESGAVTASGAVSGSFPISSNEMTVGGTSAGTVTIEKSGTLTNPAVGDKGARVAEFKLTTGGTEDVKVQRIALYSNGTISNANISNFKLYQADTLLASATGISNNLLTFDLSANPYTLAKNQNRIFHVVADVDAAAKPNETIKFYLDQSTDLYGIGASFGYGVAVTNSYEGSTNFSQVTVQGGQMTVSLNNLSAQTLATNISGQKWLEFKISAAVNMEIKKWRLELHNDTTNLDVADARICSGGTSYLTNIKIQATDGTFATDSKDACQFTNVNGNDNGIYNEYTDTLTMNAGTTKTFQVLVDSKTNVGTGGKYKAILGNTNGSTYTFSNTAVKNTSNNQYITDIVPSSNLSGNTVSFQVATVTTSLGNYTGTMTKVKGASQVDLLQYNLTAGSGSDVTVSQIKFNSYIGTNGQNPLTLNQIVGGTFAKDVVGTLSLFRRDGTNWVKVGTDASIDSAGYVTFKNLNWKVTKGSTQTIVLRGDLNNSLLASRDVAFDIANGNITAQDESSNDISSNIVAQQNGMGNNPGVKIRVALNGTLTVSDNSSPKSALVAHGTVDVPVLKVMLNAKDENYSIKKFRITQLVGGTNRSVDSVKVSYKNKDGVAKTVSMSLNGANADFDVTNDPIWVSAGAPASLDVFATVKTINSTVGAYSADQLRFSFDGDPAGNVFEAVGDSNTTKYLVDGTTTDINGNFMTIYKAYPTFSKEALNSSTLNSGSQAIYKFKVTAVGPADTRIKLKKVALKVNLAGAATGTSMTLGGFVVQEDGTNLNKADSGTDAYHVYKGTDGAVLDNAGTLSSADTGDQTIYISFIDGRTISAGSSKTYTVFATVANIATGATTYSVNTYLADTDLAQAAAGVRYLTNNGVNSKFALEDIAGANDADALYIWSDTSGTNGDSVNTDLTALAPNNGAAASSADWYNGFGLKDMGSAFGTTLTRSNN